MTMDNAQELHFVNHLFTCIKDGLTGRDVMEMVGEGPHDRFHAGVLLPLAPELPVTKLGEGENVFNSFLNDDTADHRQNTLSKVTSESTMSIDFQVCIPEDTEKFVLRIKPSFSVYYAVFPTRTEVQVSQNTNQLEDFEEDITSNTDDDPATDPADQEVEPDINILKNINDQEIPYPPFDPSTQSIKKAEETQTETIILPRKFRKRQVTFPQVEITINPQNLTSPLELRDSINVVMAAVRAEILAEDIDLWRHLGKPTDSYREISGINVLSSNEAYNIALQSAPKGEVVLPVWRAYLAISGQKTLLTSSVDDGQILRINVALVNVTPGIPKSEKRRAQLEEGALFDCGFSVDIEDCKLVPFEFQGTPKDYRYDRSFAAIGSNCIALLDEKDSRQRLYTETVPLYSQPWYRTRNNFPVAFANLDDSTVSDTLGKLDEVGHNMDLYLAEWDTYLQKPL